MLYQYSEEVVYTNLIENSILKLLLAQNKRQKSFLRVFYTGLGPFVVGYFGYASYKCLPDAVPSHRSNCNRIEFIVQHCVRQR